MEITIPKKTTFDVPEGAYSAILEDVIDNTQVANCEDGIRFRWRITDPTNKRFEYFAGKNYCADPENCRELIDDLNSWLGDSLHNYMGENGKLDLMKLKKLTADIVVTHIYNGKFEKPYAYVKAVHPPGTITKRQ